MVIPTTYAERSCKVKFTVGKASQTITVKQVSNSITVSGNNPYYQWGRKDPFLPSDGLDNTNKTWYDKDGVHSTSSPATESFSPGITCIKNYILKPNVMQKQLGGDNTYQNLWSADNYVYIANDNLVIKTIYDPSPIGFKLPASNAFTGFTTTGDYTTTFSQIKGTWDNALKGWRFYTSSVKDKTIFFPASGYRNYSNGNSTRIGISGFCWSAVSYSTHSAYCMYFTLSNVLPLHYYSRAYGFGVRSSKE